MSKLLHDSCCCCFLQAIVSSHLYIKQLVFEVIHLTEKHKVLPELAPILVNVEEVG